MSKTRDSGQKSQSTNQPDSAPATDEPEKYPPPLKPRRGLFVVFAILLVLLFAGMLTMYFETVYPNRYRPQSVETDRTAGPAVKK